MNYQSQHQNNILQCILHLHRSLAKQLHLAVTVRPNPYKFHKKNIYKN